MERFKAIRMNVYTNISDSEEFEQVHKYTVLSKEGYEFVVDNTLLFNIDYDSTEKVLTDFNTYVGQIESLLSYYSELLNKAKELMEDYEYSEYLRYKTMPKHKVYNRPMGGTEDYKEPSDKVVACVIKSSNAYKAYRQDTNDISAIVDRLEASLKIAKISWDTVRSLNSNARSLFGV